MSTLGDNTSDDRAMTAERGIHRAFRGRKPGLPPARDNERPPGGPFNFTAGWGSGSRSASGAGGVQGNFPFFPDSSSDDIGRGMKMAKRWSTEDTADLRNFAGNHSAQAIAEKMDRRVGGEAFKAHQLGVPLKARSMVPDPQCPGIDWIEGTRASVGLTDASKGRRLRPSSRRSVLMRRRCEPSRCGRHPARGRQRCPR